MQLAITVDQRYWQTPDGAVWTRMPPDYGFFERHLEVFESVQVVARAVRVPEPPAGSVRVDGPGIEFSGVPGYAGPAQFLASAAVVLRSLHRAISSADAILIRVPSNLANCLRMRRRPYAVDVLGDPAELYSRGAVGTPLRPLYRSWFVSSLMRQCRNAVSAAYVSRALAARYPSRSTHILLDIDLPEEAFAAQPRKLPSDGVFEIVSIGGFDHPVKGHDVLIKAIARLRQSGLAVRLTIVGDGVLRPQLAALAERCNVPVEFAGQLAGSAEVRSILQRAHLFALASRSEGKPRSLIEALALGVPAVATNVGGIPELLPTEQLVSRDDPAALASAIAATLKNPSRYEQLSGQGIHTARRYARAAEWDRRRQFLDELKSAAACAIPTTRSHGFVQN